MRKEEEGGLTNCFFTDTLKLRHIVSSFYIWENPGSERLPGGTSDNPPANAGDIRDLDLIPGLGRSLEKGTATHSSILAWRIPWTEEPGGLRSMGSQKIKHNCSKLARGSERLNNLSWFSANNLLSGKIKLKSVLPLKTLPFSYILLALGDRKWTSVSLTSVSCNNNILY